MTEQSEQKPKKIKIYSEDEVTLHGRIGIEEPRPHTDVVVIPYPFGQVTDPGTKCEHGGYIPSTHPDPDRAPYCSICYPYLLTLKE